MLDLKTRGLRGYKYAEGEDAPYCGHWWSCGTDWWGFEQSQGSEGGSFVSYGSDALGRFGSYNGEPFYFIKGSYVVGLQKTVRAVKLWRKLRKYNHTYKEVRAMIR